MRTTANLLVELFVEELPSKVLENLGKAFALELYLSLGLSRLVYPQPAFRHEPDPPPQWVAFASPRRLAVLIRDVQFVGEPGDEEIKLMPVAVGLDASGQATPALLRKLAALGETVDAVATLKREVVGKADSLFLSRTTPGATLAEGLQKALDAALERLPIPKVMQYQLADGWTSVRFVRPAHGLVALHGDAVVPISALGLAADRATHGHRFEATVDPIQITHADTYAQQLETEGAVIASFDARRAEISRQLQAAATAEHLVPIDDPLLLDEVCALVERPNVLRCSFETEFLAVPPECLILTMKANQKYFPLLDAAGALTNQFLVVSNIRPADPSRVIQGNERVVRPRLADAKFFFDQDRKRTLESRVASLDKVVYHAKLGSQGERTERVRAIARGIGALLGGAALAAQADRAALLAKADLVTDMVGEFPELQGTMGGYYARHDGETDAVALAIEDHYKPRFAGDVLPRNAAGMAVALADKLETLVGLFGIGQLPTGDKDPYSLRRHALGVIRMLREPSVALALPALVALAVPVFGARIADPTAAVLEFVRERLSGSLREQGYSAQEVDAVLALAPARFVDVAARLEAVRAFAVMPEAVALAAANKRVANILKKAPGEVAARVDAALLTPGAEAALHAALMRVRPAADTQFERGDYAGSLSALAAMRAPVDAFFESVMVNADDPALRANRLGLLATLHAAMNRVADLSKLVT